MSATESNAPALLDGFTIEQIGRVAAAIQLDPRELAATHAGRARLRTRCRVAIDARIHAFATRDDLTALVQALDAHVAPRRGPAEAVELTTEIQGARALADAAAAAVSALAQARRRRLAPLRKRKRLPEEAQLALEAACTEKRALAVQALEALVPHASLVELDTAELGVYLRAVRDGAEDEPDDRGLARSLATASGVVPPARRE